MVTIIGNGHGDIMRLFAFPMALIPPEKGMNPIILSPEWTGLINLGMATNLREGKP